jgi:hypothetical protein
VSPFQFPVDRVVYPAPRLLVKVNGEGVQLKHTTNGLRGSSALLPALALSGSMITSSRWQPRQAFPSSRQQYISHTPRQIQHFWSGRTSMSTVFLR